MALNCVLYIEAMVALVALATGGGLFSSRNGQYVCTMWIDTREIPHLIQILLKLLCMSMSVLPLHIMDMNHTCITFLILYDCNHPL